MLHKAFIFAHVWTELRGNERTYAAVEAICPKRPGPWLWAGAAAGAAAGGAAAVEACLAGGAAGAAGFLAGAAVGRRGAAPPR